MSDRVIDYFFTVASPWSYFGHRRLREIADRHQAAIALKPVRILEVFNVSGGLPLGKRAPQRQAYRLQELRRWSAFLDVPVNQRPKHFPVDDTFANKMIIAADRQGADAFGLAYALMQGVWIEEQNVAEPETLREIALTCGLDAEALVGAIDDPDIDAALTANTNEAIGRQVFGMPTYLLGEEMFWGQDRLDFLDRALAATG